MCYTCHMFLHINLILLLEAIGYLGLFGIIFAESGLLVGFFLPGDTLLFTAGLLCATHFFSIYLVIILGILGALLGDSFGYYSHRAHIRTDSCRHIADELQNVFEVECTWWNYMGNTDDPSRLRTWKFCS